MCHHGDRISRCPVQIGYSNWSEKEDPKNWLIIYQNFDWINCPEIRVWRSFLSESIAHLISNVSSLLRGRGNLPSIYFSKLCMQVIRRSRSSDLVFVNSIFIWAISELQFTYANLLRDIITNLIRFNHICDKSTCLHILFFHIVWHRNPSVARSPSISIWNKSKLDSHCGEKESMQATSPQIRKICLSYSDTSEKNKQLLSQWCLMTDYMYKYI